MVAHEGQCYFQYLRKSKNFKKGDYCDKIPCDIRGFCQMHKAAHKESTRSTLDLCPSYDQLRRVTELDIMQREQVRDMMLVRRIKKWWLSYLSHYKVRNMHQIL